MSRPEHSLLPLAGEARPGDAGGPSARPRGVLVVDDNEDIRQVLRVGLRHYGFSVWLAGSGREAVDIYRTHCAVIDVALLDVLMPGLDGPGTLAALRELDAHVRVCFMTGDAGGYSEQDLLGMGTHVVFRKPFHLVELAEQLTQLTTPLADTDELYESLQGWRGDDSASPAAQ